MQRRRVVLGIGLNICQTIIEHHGGRIWAERNQAGGLDFHLLLPTEHAAPTRTDDEAAVADASPPEESAAPTRDRDADRHALLAELRQPPARSMR